MSIVVVQVGKAPRKQEAGFVPTSVTPGEENKTRGVFWIAVKTPLIVTRAGALSEHKMICRELSCTKKELTEQDRHGGRENSAQFGNIWYSDLGKLGQAVGAREA